jgi:hypothetical protein
MFASAIILSVLGLAAAAPAPAGRVGTTHLQVARGGSFDGTATYYYQGGNPGSCGDYHGGESSPLAPACLIRHHSFLLLPSTR